ncbi:MAG TPA: NAD(P)-dependent oxidoreductase [Alphaproteobacteria bacterium]|jgi:3-oxoacyl-[acyl-carrier protein] reductase|nr:NAD(P)-dependent oxidoreductase [Alphaproteobacteria bacterium]HAM46662.1 NAD(P)-dependent oxidoreductase [Alphaproteobacteria bacterium]HBA41850.1 NAD(P)-dependent oxidoreductase [Alphaproteobacteria bacterium]HBC52719.1 NAD(P)-dependent oxidoreductase [Alphaproteobacteria bacterium]HBF99616.1 NAD(P)-dependent oxidoreductase [Alphaproteobacteria bacterium]
MARLSKLSRSVEGRGVLITGAASGMGRATAHLFADEGAQVAVTDLTEEGVAKVVDEITAAGGQARGWVLNVADADAIERIVPEIGAAFGRLDIIVNNAGIGAGSAIESSKFERRWQKAMDVMLAGPVRIVRAAMPYLRKSDAPRIVNIASTEALGATPKGVPYAAAKTGLVGVTRSLAVELGGDGFTVNCICPGAVHTGLTTVIPDEHKQIYARRRVPANRYADPEEIAHMTLSLCLPAASYTNGAIIPVDGGLTIKNG